MALLLSQLANSTLFSATLSLSQSFRNVRNCSLTAGYDDNLLGGFFHPKLVPWAIPSDRLRTGGSYRFETQHDLGWIGQTFPVSFDPAQESWTIAADRLVSGIRYQRDTNTDVSWLSNSAPIGGWNAPTDRLARVLGRWTLETNLDNAWLFSVQPVPFDGALFPSIAELVGWWTPASAVLQTAYYLALMDLSWVHDVIPLVDPVPSAFIKLRPIAPIMSARRRKRRR